MAKPPTHRRQKFVISMLEVNPDGLSSNRIAYLFRMAQFENYKFWSHHDLSGTLNSLRKQKRVDLIRNGSGFIYKLVL